MKNRFTIGQMAQLHNIPVKTLRYYDKIGLFKPIEVDENNGYRYYSTEQFEKLNTINYLKVLGISLKEIKNLLEVRDIDYFLKQLEKQKEITENKIRELELIRKVVDNRIKEITKARKINNLETVILKTIDERKIFSLKEDINSEHELEISLRKLENKINRRSTIIIGKVGLTVSIENLTKKNFHEYNSIFILAEEDTCYQQLVSILPHGQYACLYYRGNHSESEKYYEKLLDYLEENNYKIIGDSIERTMINEFISKNKDDYLTEIQIPVKKI